MSERISAPGSVASLASRLGQKYAPTPEQEKVIDYPLKPLLVVAGAGSGKTTTMGLRVAHLVDQGVVRPDQVLGLTFTRKATSQLSRNVRGLLGNLESETLLEQPEISTYNSFAAAVARDFGLRLGENPDAQHITDGHAIQLMKEIVAGAPGDYSVIGKTIDATAGNARNLAAQLRDNLIPVAQARQELIDYAEQCAQLFEPRSKTAKVHGELSEILNGHVPDDARRVLSIAQGLNRDGAEFLKIYARRLALLDFVEVYEEKKRELGVIEFSDQVAIAAMVAEIPDVQRVMRERYRLVLLDEFQDTSVMQLEFLLRLFGPDHGITAVGDPNQAIYGWRGASAQALADFQSRFSTGGPVETLPLNRSFRNDRLILDAANHLAHPLQLSTGAVPVPLLDAADHAGPGQVAVSVAADTSGEMESIVRAISRVWEPGKNKTIAVLARTRATLEEVAAALLDAGIPHEVNGLSGLLSTPEVADLRALLDVANDASRGDAAGRLLSRCRLGTADIMVLSSWARELTRRNRGEAAGDSSTEGEAVKAIELPATTLVEVLNTLPPESHITSEGHRLSETGRARLEDLRDAIFQVRAAFGSHLEDIVATAERALRLDIDVMARPKGPGLASRRHLDRFRQVARSFVAVVPEGSTLTSFLAWLATADSVERGLDQEAEIVVPASEGTDGAEHLAVQLMTIHAAKGLEFDHVVVAGMQEGRFPSHQSYLRQYDFTRSAWLTDISQLPWRLRRDHDSLPEFTGEKNSVTPDAADDSPMGAFLNELGGGRLTSFKKAAAAYALQEERRLAYVAATRAKETLVLTSCWWANTTRPKVLSRFLVEILPATHELANSDKPIAQSVSAWLAAGTPSASRPGDVWWTAGSTADGFATPFLRDINGNSVELEMCLVAPEGLAKKDRELTDDTDAPTYPSTDTAIGHRKAALQRSAEHVQFALAQPDAAPAGATSRLLKEADLVIAQAAAQRGSREIVIEAPGRLSATQVQSVSSNPEEYLAYLRRPLPARPSDAARLGTEFHRWVEEYYLKERLIEIPGADDYQLPKLETWQENFRNSRFESMDPIAVEETLALSVPVGEKQLQIQCKIDALFETDDGLLVVDWKTGSPPRTEQSLAIRSLQLQIYRHAVAAARGLDPDTIEACFFYVAHGEEIHGVKMSVEEIAQQLSVLDPVSRDLAIGAELNDSEYSED